MTDETTPQPAAADAPAAPARAPRRRRATAPASAPAAVGTAAPPEAAVADEAPAAPAPSAADEAPESVDAAPPRRRRAATRRAKAPVEAAQEPAVADDTAPAVETVEAGAAEPELAAPAGTEDAEDAEGELAADAASTRTPASVSTLDVLAELGPVAAATTAERPRLATTAVLFQAPDTRPRRRRAQAPAGPPKPDEVEQPVVEAVAPQAEELEQPRAARRGRGKRRAAEPAAAAPVDDEALLPVASDEVPARGEDEDEPAAEDGVPEPSDGEEDQAEDGDQPSGTGRRRRRRGGRGRRRSGAGEADGETEDPDAAEAETVEDEGAEDEESDEGEATSRRRRRRRRSGRGETEEKPTRARATRSDEVTALKGSTRLEAKRQRRREGRDAGRRRAVLTEAEFLARREAVVRSMVVREAGGRVQIAVLEDGVLVEHYVSRSGQGGTSMTGNVYLGRVQNVLPSMEAAFVDVGKGRNAVLYAGEVNWDAAGLEGQPRRIEQALKSGDSVLVQVTKDPIGHKGARLTSQITLAGRYLVYVPAGGMTGISRKLPENERARLKKLLKEIVPEAAGVIVRTAAEGASEEELRRDVERLQEQWAAIEKRAKTASAPALLQGEPDLAIRVVRDIFNDDFTSLVVQGDDAWSMISDYVGAMAPDLAERVSRWTGSGDVFAEHRVDEQLAKGMDRKVWLPSGGSLVIDRTEAMTVIDVNTGKFTGSGGTLEETVTRNNLEAAEEIVRQLRLRDIGGIIVIDFIDMVLESNRDLVLRRLVECLGRDRTKHQVAEVTSLGLVQMTRKRVGQGLVEAFSETCQHCNGRGFLVHTEPVERGGQDAEPEAAAPSEPKRSRRKRAAAPAPQPVPVLPEAREAVKATLATIAAAAAHAHEHAGEHAELAGEHAEHAEGHPADAAERVAPEVAPAAGVTDGPESSETPVEPSGRVD